MTYIDPSGKILAHTWHINQWNEGKAAPPINIEWDLTNRCSLGCAGCHFGYTHTRGPLANKRSKPEGAISGGDVADAVLVKRVLYEASGEGVKSITWTGGGEPTLHPQFDQIAKAAAGEGFSQGLYTHGGHIDKDRGKLIGDTLEWVVVSLDCDNAADYAAYKGVDESWFDKAVLGIANMVGKKCVVGVSFLLNADNWRSSKRMADLASGLGANYVTFRPMVYYDMADPAMPTGDREWIDEALPKLHELKREGGDFIEYIPQRFTEYRDWQRQRPYEVCYGVRFSATITPNGKVWICPNRREFPDSLLGDLNVESFGNIWARHPGQWTDFEKCRTLCRLHMMNRTLWEVYRPREHAEFI